MASLPQLVDALIVGAGPAGLNAALPFARSLSTAIVFDSGTYRNQGITHMHTVASRDHQDPLEFRRIARSQIESRYSTIYFHTATITHAVKKPVGPPSAPLYPDGFEVKDSEGNVYAGKKLILATGSKDIFPSIPGFRENWPQHIYQCLVCDGYEQRGTPIGILGLDNPFAAHMVQMATPFDSRITVFSNGAVSSEKPIQDAVKLMKAYGARIDERRITRLVNNGPSHEEGVTVEFETGNSVTVGFLATRTKVVNAAQELIEQLGVETVDEAMGGHVKIVNPMFNETSVRGVFAAGDTMVMMKQVAIAMAEGLKAAAGAMYQLGQERSEVLLKEYEEKEKGVQV